MHVCCIYKAITPEHLLLQDLLTWLPSNALKRGMLTAMLPPSTANFFRAFAVADGTLMAVIFSLSSVLLVFIQKHAGLHQHEEVTVGRGECQACW